jgi:hypothetical protein
VLYDAFGQREVSTMYTALNQYFVVMEVDPKYQLSPDALNGIFIKSSTGAMVPLSAIAKFEPQRTLAAGEPPGLSIRHVTLHLSTWRPTWPWATPSPRLKRPSARWACPRRFTPPSREPRRPFQDSLKNEPY